MPITERAAIALPKGQTHSEKVAGRGAGSLLLIGRDSTVSAYYRYTAPDGSRPWIELGGLGQDIELAEARARCAKLAALRRLHPELKAWVESEQRKEAELLLKEEQQRELEERSATFEDLLNDYLGNMVAHGQVSEPAVRKVFEKDVVGVFPAMVSLKARDIRPADISRLLKPISARNALVYRNRVRSYLHAAFAFALRHEYDETRESGKTYGLEANPVTAIPVLGHAEKAGERALSDQELKQLYNHLHEVNSVSPQMANLVRFLIVIGGQRPLQVLRATWDDYDLDQRTLLIRDLKGKRKDHGGKYHLVPLPKEALVILKDLRSITGKYQWPFTTKGETPISIGSLKNVFKRFRASEFGKLNGTVIPHFTARDLRRTTKQLMTRAGIRRDLRNLLQNHGQTGVDVQNYANDPAAFLPEKRKAMKLYSRALSKALKA